VGLAGLIRRQWALFVVGVLATLVGGGLAHRAPGVYHERIDVVFLMPADEGAGQNTFQYSTQSLIGTAGVVARIVQDGRAGGELASENATLIGEGVTHGYSVRLPNSGGQWAYDFESPVLSVETVGRSTAEVEATTSMVLSRITTTLAQMQESEGVPARARIRTRFNPPNQSISFSRGSRARAVGASQLLGLGVTFAAVYFVDGLRRRRSTAAGSDDGATAGARVLTPA
jgi:hypothetical protein